jgi:hypothetical protein
MKAIDLILVEKCQKSRRGPGPIDFERMRGKRSATSGEITPEEREGIEQELMKAGEPEFM